MAARWRLYDNAGTKRETKDHYTLFDSKPSVVDREKWFYFVSFNGVPTHPQMGIWLRSELPAKDYYRLVAEYFRPLGKRIGMEDLPYELRKLVIEEIKEVGGNPESAYRGKYSLTYKKAHTRCRCKTCRNRGWVKQYIELDRPNLDGAYAVRACCDCGHFKGNDKRAAKAAKFDGVNVELFEPFLILLK